MTTPDPSLPGGVSNHDATTDETDPVQLHVRALLRAEPIDVDPTRRDAAIEAALGAAAHTNAEAGAPTLAHRRRHRSTVVRPLLAAAAALAVLGGTTAVLLRDDPGAEHLATAAAPSVSAAGSADSSSPESGADSPSSAGATADAEALEGVARESPAEAAPSTTAAAASPPAPSDLPELGSFARRAEVLAAAAVHGAVGALPGSSSPTTDAPLDATALDPSIESAMRACIARLASGGAEPRARAILDGVPVLVVEDSSGTATLVEATTCVTVHGVDDG